MKKSLYLSILSVFSSLAVIALHTNGCFWSFSTEPYWISANIIECVMFFAVPVFFMISGATLMDYRDRYTTKDYIIKRVSKTLFPFIAWNFIALLFRLFETNNLYLNDISFLRIIEMITNNEILYIYWFFMPLFGVYMSIPLLSAISKDKRKSVFTYIAIVGFTFNCLFPFISNLINISHNNELNVGVVSNYLLYVVVGYLLHTYDCDKKWRIAIYTLGIVGFFTHVIGTQYLSTLESTIVETFKGYNNVPCVLYSIAIFVFIKQLISRIETNKIIMAISKLNKYTFPAYLMHWFVMHYVVKFLSIDTRSLTYRLIAPFVIFGICVLITKLIRKIPKSEYLLP